MKRFISSADVSIPFSPANNTVDLSNLAPAVSQGRLLAIVDVTTDQQLYKVGQAGYGFVSWSGSVVKLQASASNCASSDQLLVIWDDNTVPALDTSLQAIKTALGSPLQAGGAVTVSGVAQDATLQSILTALKAQVNLADSLFTDGTSYYVRRESVNEGTGAVTIFFVNVDGSTPNPAPTAANLKPAAGTSRVPESAFFDVVTAGTGTSVGDLVARVLIYDVTAGTLAATLWLNMTTGAILTTAPSAAAIKEQTQNTAITSIPLPPNAAKEAGGNLAAVATVLGTQSDAAVSAPGVPGSAISLLQKALSYLSALAGAVVAAGLKTVPQANAQSVSASGSVAAQGSNVTLLVDGMTTASVQILGTWTGALTFQGSPDGGTTFYPVNAVPVPNGGAAGPGVGSASANGWWELGVGGFTHAQVVAAAALSSGSATVNLRATTGAKSTRVSTPPGAPISTAGSATAFTDRSGQTSATANQVTSPFGTNALRQFARITNTYTGGTGQLYVYDKASGTPTTSNSVLLQAGQSITWDAKVPSNAISVFSPQTNVTFEAAEG